VLGVSAFDSAPLFVFHSADKALLSSLTSLTESA